MSLKSRQSLVEERAAGRASPIVRKGTAFFYDVKQRELFSPEVVGSDIQA